MDPIGNVPIYLSLLKDFPEKRQRRIILREKLIALVVIFFFYFLGRYFLALLQITESTLQISGGIILFLIALRMIFPSKQIPESQGSLIEEPFLVPLAIPLVAGPSVLATVMIYSSQKIFWVSTSIAILAAWLVSTLILFFSPTFRKVLKKPFLIALERLMGLILVMLAMQMFLKGLGDFILSIR